MDAGLAQFIVCAILIEAVVAGVKPIWDREKRPTWDNVAALVVALLVTVLGKVDLFKATGFELPAWVGAALTGIILSRGSNVVADVIKLIREVTQAVRTGGPQGLR